MAAAQFPPFLRSSCGGRGVLPRPADTPTPPRRVLGAFQGQAQHEPGLPPRLVVCLWVDIVGGYQAHAGASEYSLPQT